MGLLMNKIYANFLLIKCSLDKKQYCCVLTLMFTSPIVKQNQELDQNMKKPSGCFLEFTLNGGQGLAVSKQKRKLQIVVERVFHEG